jgi:hypothetical protein
LGLGRNVIVAFNTCQDIVTKFDTILKNLLVFSSMLMHIETLSHGSNKSFKILANKKKVDNFVLEENH